MNILDEVLKNNKTSVNPIWIMRQAGRYLPEFREIRKNNENFIKLCLNHELSSEITLQPIKRFDLDAAIIFSDILMVPYGLNQKVEFKKNFGPILGDLTLDEMLNTTERNFIESVLPIYKAINSVSKNDLIKNKKSTIGFVGAPWTLMVYMINKQSPKLSLKKDFFSNEDVIEKLFLVLDKFLKIHIKNQIENGAQIIQIFDSWAGLLDEKDLPKYVYNPTFNLVEYVKALKVPVICFPRGIKNYKTYCEIVKPDAICIDYEVDPLKIVKEIQIPVQGGMDPKVLLTDKDNLKKEALKYLDIFKDHPYIFNLGHGVLPETNPNMMDYLVKTVKNY
jgi:uroporphyrinogen decarboxylase